MRNLSRPNIRVAKTLLTTVGGFFSPHIVKEDESRNITVEVPQIHPIYKDAAMNNNLKKIIGTEAEKKNRENLGSREVAAKVAKEKTLRKLNKKEVGNSKEYTQYIEDNLHKVQIYVHRARLSLQEKDIGDKVLTELGKDNNDEGRYMRPLGTLGLIEPYHDDFTFSKDYYDKYIETNTNFEPNKKIEVEFGDDDEKRFDLYYGEAYVKKMKDHLQQNTLGRDEKTKYVDVHNQQKLIPNKYVNNINISKQIEIEGRKTGGWDYLKGDLVKDKYDIPFNLKIDDTTTVNRNSGFKDNTSGQVDLMAVSLREEDEDRGAEDGYDSSDYREETNTHVQLFSCEIDLGMMGKNNSREHEQTKVGIQYAYHNKTMMFGSWLGQGKGILPFTKRENNEQYRERRDRSDAAKQSIWVNGGSNKKKYTRKNK